MRHPFIYEHAALHEVVAPSEISSPQYAPLAAAAGQPEMHRSAAAAAVAPLRPDVAALVFSCSSGSHFLHAAVQVRAGLRAAPAVATRRAAQKMTHCSSVYPSFCGTATHKLSVHGTNMSRHSVQLQAPDRLVPFPGMPPHGDPTTAHEDGYEEDGYSVRAAPAAVARSRGCCPTVQGGGPELLQKCTLRLGRQAALIMAGGPHRPHMTSAPAGNSRSRIISSVM